MRHEAEHDAVQPLADRYAGCLLGLALGDALGAPLEGGPIERLAWRLIGKTRGGHMRWTDDTQMSLDLADSLIAKGTLDLDDVAARFAKSYRWSRGYGPGAAKLLKRIKRGAAWRDANKSVYPDGSFGNGGAMRAPVIGLFCARDADRCARWARDAASITHAHPLGMEGAVLIASATAAAWSSQEALEILDLSAAQCREAPFLRKLAVVRTWTGTGERPTAKEVVRQLGNGVAAVDSCVTALHASLRLLREPFDELMRFVAECGGDVDTIGAMSGAIWGASNGASRLPSRHLQRLEARARIQTVSDALLRSSLAHFASDS